MNIRPFRDGVEAPLADLWTRCGLARPWIDPFSDIPFTQATAQTEIFVGEWDSAIIASMMTVIAVGSATSPSRRTAKVRTWGAR